MTKFDIILVMEEILQKIGLADNEAKLYLYLLKNPNKTAQQLAKETGIQRTNIYRLLDRLIEYQLISSDDSPVKTFVASAPQNLQVILNNKQTELKQVSASLSALMPVFRAQHSLSLDKPGVLHMANKNGLELLLKDMAHSRTEILLFASDDVPLDQETLASFRQLIYQRKKNGILTRALFHNGNRNEEIINNFSEMGIFVRFLGSVPFRSDIAIYENNIAFTVYEPSLNVTVITNVHIAGVMRLLFEQLWDSSEQRK
jgi:transposase-like protein